MLLDIIKVLGTRFISKSDLIPVELFENENIWNIRALS